MDLSRTEFEAVVDEALATLPKRFADLVVNVSITVEEEPRAEDTELFDDDEEGHEILGIYRGVALTERTYGYPPTMPDEIAIFRGPINRVTRSRDEAIEQIRETVIHELGHYFGLDDDELP